MYSQFEVQRGLPITLLVKYFQQVGDRWQISQKIRHAVQYREFNLLNDPAALGRFDVVFCRNVLIYFDQPTKTKVLNGIAKQMPTDGYLILGGAETVLGLTERFQLVPGQRGIYCIAGSDTKPDATARPSMPGTGSVLGAGNAGMPGLAAPAKAPLGSTTTALGSTTAPKPPLPGFTTARKL
jgi:chemotaxis protein methyltransferase CheR